jgi:PAS domain-containing protein
MHCVLPDASDAPRFTIREVNDAYLAATMTTREGIVGRGVFEAFPDNPDDPTIKGVSTLRASLERVLATREPNVLPGLKYDVARADGSFEQRWWSPVNSPVFDESGAVEAIIHNANGVTEQRRAETALRELNETLEQRVAERTAERDRAWQLSQDLLVTARSGGVLESVNARWTELLGWEPEELIGSTFMELTHPDDLEATQAAFVGIFEARSPSRLSIVAGKERPIFLVRLDVFWCGVCC